MAKKINSRIIKNSITCKDCINSYDPDYSNLSFSTHEPILCKCKYSQYSVLYNSIDKNCQNSKPKIKKI
jgi:hypothetical protein